MKFAFELEEQGLRGNLTICGEATCEIHPAERRRYDYPGCPEWTSVESVKIFAIISENRTYLHEDRPWLCSLVESHAMGILQSGME